MSWLVLVVTLLSGTSEAPADVIRPDPAVRSARTANIIPESIPGVWGALSRCESGGDPTAVSPSGTYRGLYQFDRATWRSVGGTGDPAAASASEQTMRAKRLQAERGWSPWPACSRAIGLR